MAGEWARLSAALLIWVPSLLLLYRVEVLEERRAAEAWERVFTGETLRYRIRLVEPSGIVRELGILKHEVEVQGDRAFVYTDLRNPGRVSVNAELEVSRGGGFLSARGRAELFGKRFAITANRSGNVVELRVEHPDGVMNRRLPVSVLSPESASGLGMLVPFRDLAGFRPGKKWEAFVLDLEAHRVRPAVATVSSTPVSIPYRGRGVPAFHARLMGLNGYEGWYARDGRVLKQVIPYGGYRLILERESEDE